LAKWYEAALVEQESSGLSVAEFADVLGLTSATLYQWRRRLAPVDDRPREARSTPSGLVEVTVDGGVIASDVDPFVVRLGCDRDIEVPRSFDESDLRRLVAVLESC
jgi:hypothetical protein